MRLAILATSAVFCAGAAWGQIQIGRGQFEPEQWPERELAPGMEPAPPCVVSVQGPAKASKKFVENFNAASHALTDRDWAAALDAVALARPHAEGQRQEAALMQIEVAAYWELGTPGAREQVLETALAAPCIPSAVRRNYRQMLDKLRAGEGAPQQP